MEDETRPTETPERLKGKRLVYKKPLQKGETIQAPNGISLNFDREWSDGGTEWVIPDGSWIIRANSKGVVTAVDPLG